MVRSELSWGYPTLRLQNGAFQSYQEFGEDMVEKQLLSFSGILLCEADRPSLNMRAISGLWGHWVCEIGAHRVRAGLGCFGQLEASEPDSSRRIALAMGGSHVVSAMRWDPDFLAQVPMVCRDPVAGPSRNAQFPQGAQ